MQYKVSELEGPLLDAAVAKAVFGHVKQEGGVWLRRNDGGVQWWPVESYGALWQDGGPIIDLEQISIQSPDVLGPPHTEWRAEIMGTILPGLNRAVAFGKTPLVAAMRAHVASKCGDVVEIP